MSKRHDTQIFSAIGVLALLLLATCSTGGKPSNVVELENKGSVAKTPTPAWVKTYLAQGVSALQAQPQHKDRYCVVGEESGANRQFVLAWADQASAQQRIGSLLRTNIASRYQAAVSGAANSGAANSGAYQQQIDSVLNAVANVSYSGARREADWWSLRRRYDADNKAIHADEYTAYVLYTVPKAELNRQIALALQTSVSKDSALYDVTIALARDILLQGYDQKELAAAAAIEKTAADSYSPPGSPTAQALEEISLLDEYAVGRDVAAAILSGYNIWDGSPRLAEYASLLCAAIAVNSPKPSLYNGYHAAVLDSGEINAFATPGGHIFITRGLVNAAKSEDALAAVIAHEVAHIQLGHGLRAVQSNRGVEDWFAQFASAGARTIAAAVTGGYSQAQEFDADIAALALLAAAGYDPQGLVEVLKELQKTQPGIGGGFNASHPSPTARLVNAQVAAARYPPFRDSRATAARQTRFAAVNANAVK